MKLLIPLLFVATICWSQKSTSTLVNNDNILDATGILNGNNPSIWTNGVPADGDTVNVLLPTNFSNSNISLGQLNIDIPTSANYTIYFFGIPIFTIPINLPDNYIILPGHTIEVTDQIHLNRGNIIANGDLIIRGDQNNYGRIASVDQGTITGNFTYQKWVDRCNRWSLYGGPFDASLNDFAAASNNSMVYTGIPDGTWPSFSWINTYLVDEDWSNVGYDGYVVPSSCNDIIPRGVGFWHWNSDTSYNSATTGSIPQQWQVSTTGNIDFSTPFTFGVQHTNTGNTAYDGWNLLANPYPGTIDWDASGWSRNGLDNALYEYNTCTQTYSTYVGGIGTNGGDQYVSPFQGFYVKANTAAPHLSCESSVIVSHAHPLKNNLNNNILRLELGQDEAVVRLNNQATHDFDPNFDGFKFLSGYDRIYTKSRSIHESYSINSIKDTPNIIPLYTLGNGNLHIAEISNWNSNLKIYLENITTGQTFPIDEGDLVPFTSIDTVNFQHSFNIVFKNLNVSPLSIDKSSVHDYDLNITRINQQNIKISSNYSAKPVSIEVYNSMGQLIYDDYTTISKNGVIIPKDLQFGIIRVYNDEIDVTKKTF